LSGNLTSDEERAADEQQERQKIATERLAARALRIGTIAEDARAVEKGAKQTIGAFGKTGTQADVLRAQRDLDEYKTKAGLDQTGANLTTLLPDQQKAIAGLQQVLGLAQRADQIATRTASRAAAIETGGIAAGGNAIAIGGIRGQRLQLVASTRAAVQAAASEAQTLVDQGASPDRIAQAVAKAQALQTAGQQQIGAFDKDAKVASGNIIAGSQSAIRSSGFRIGFDSAREERERINEKFREPLATAERTYGAGSKEVTALQDQRNQEQAEADVKRKRGNDQLIIAADAETNVLRLRESKDYQQADLAQLKESNREKLQALKESGASPEAQAVAQRQANAAESLLGSQQSEATTVAGLSRRARRQIAIAQGKGQDRVAGLTGTIEGLRERLIGTPADQRADEAGTQAVELQSIRQQILRPRAGGRQYDPSREYFGSGSPASREATQTNELLKLIETYLKQIKDRNPGALVG
jgi:hypothetical protein